MGSGKTRHGKKLAAKTNMQFIDLDEVLMESMGKSISEIFAEYGEIYFREMESAFLKNTADFDHTIVSCGGGTPCFFDNMDWILANGKCIHLTAPVEIIFGRLREKKDKRPLLRNMDDAELRLYIENKLLERAPFYSRAHATVDTSQADKEELMLQLVNSWNS